MLFVLGFGAVATAQSYDLSLTTDNYTTLQATSDDPLELDFTVTNVGATTIPMGDSIYFAVTDGSSYWSTNTLAAGYVTYVILPAAMAPSDNFQMDVATISMAWVYDNIGLTGNVCVTILGVNYTAATPPTMLTPLNDGNCVQYTVTEVAGIDNNENVAISVYPNPAVDVINFQMNNNAVDLIKIFDISGREITILQVSSALESVNTEDFEAGVYIYQIINEGTIVKTDKFTVAK